MCQVQYAALAEAHDFDFFQSVDVPGRQPQPAAAVVAQAFGGGGSLPDQRFAVLNSSRPQALR